MAANLLEAQPKRGVPRTERKELKSQEVMTQFTDKNCQRQLDAPDDRKFVSDQRLLCEMEMQAWSVAVQDQKERNAQVNVPRGPCARSLQ